MKRFGIAVFGFIAVAVCRCLADAPAVDLTKKEEVEVRKSLEAYERGGVSLDELTEGPEAKLQRLVSYYRLHTNDVSLRAKLPISRSLGALGMWPEALPLAMEYLQVYSNDWHAW